MTFTSLKIAAAGAMASGLLVSGLAPVAAATPAQAVAAEAAQAVPSATYPPTKPVRCGARIKGKKIGIKIRPIKNKGYKFEVQKRLKKGKWVVKKRGKTKASNGERTVKVKPGRYRVKCIGGPDRLDGITLFGSRHEVEVFERAVAASRLSPPFRMSGGSPQIAFGPGNLSYPCSILDA